MAGVVDFSVGGGQSVPPVVVLPQPLMSAQYDASTEDIDADILDLEPAVEEFIVGTDVPTGLQITTASLPAGTQGQPYNQTFAASGGSGTYVNWQIISGVVNPFTSGGTGPNPPPALVLNYTGVLQCGSLPNAETNNITVQVTDSQGNTATKSFSLVTNSAAQQFTLTGIYSSAIDSHDTRYYVANNDYTGAAGGALYGWTARMWDAYQPFTYVEGNDKAGPLVSRGWYGALGFYASGGSSASAPLVSSGIQISALTKAKFRFICEPPIDRTTTFYDCLFDLYFHTISNPTGSDTGTSLPIQSLEIFANYIDSADAYSLYIIPQGPVDTGATVTYGNRIELAGNMYFYVLQNNSWAQTVPSGSGLYNTIALFPAPWNDSEQTGKKFVYIDYHQLILDVLAADLPLALTSSHYMSNISVGWEVDAGGPTSPTDQRYYYTWDFQTAIQTEADPVLFVAREISTLISRKLPAYCTGTPTQPVAYAVNANYNQHFESGAAPSTGTPQDVIIDCSTVSDSLKANGVLTFYTVQPQLFTSTSGTPGNFTIDINNAAGGGSPPTSGWVNAATVTGNIEARRSTIFGNWAGYNWVRIRTTAIANGNTQTNLYMKVDVHNAPTQTNPNIDGIALFGDDHTAWYYTHGDTQSGGAADFAGNMLQHYSGHVPIWLNVGVTGLSLCGAPSSSYPGMLPYFMGTQVVNFTGSLALGATSATLTANWTGATGTYNITLSSGTTVAATLTNGSAAVTWSGGLAALATSLASMQIGTVTFSSITASSTSATLDSGTYPNGWPFISGVYSLTLSNAQVVYATFTNGSSAVTLATAPSASVTDTATVASWMYDVPVRHFFLMLGYHDSAAGVSSSQFEAALTLAINIALSLNKIVWVPSIMYSLPDTGTTSTTWSGYVTSVLSTFSGNPNVNAGPDINTLASTFSPKFFVSARDTTRCWIFGQAIMRSLLVDWIGRVVYLGQPASTWKPDFSGGTGVGGNT